MAKDCIKINKHSCLLELCTLLLYYNLILTQLWGLPENKTGFFLEAAWLYRAFLCSFICTYLLTCVHPHTVTHACYHYAVKS